VRDSVDEIVDGWRAARADLDVAPVEVVLRITRLRAILERETEALFAEHGLTAATFSALAAIARLEGDAGVGQVRLMRELSLTSGTISVRVDRLVAEGLAERRPDPGDARGTRIRLTAAGRAAFDRAAPAHLDNERRLLAALSPQDRQELARLLRVLLADLEGPGAAVAADPLGLSLIPAHRTAAMRRAVGLADRGGVLVEAVAPDGPATDAGVRPGDVIIEAAGRRVCSAADLVEAVRGADGRLSLLLARGDGDVCANVMLGPSPRRPAPRSRIRG
jgi:DNA-binding MarR family transcriptional regulator